MADAFAAGFEALRRRMQGLSPAPAQRGKPPLAAYHESVRLLPDAALRVLQEAGADLFNPKVSDRQMVNDLRIYNKLQAYPWPEKPKQPGATDATPGGAPRY